jgi:hypothetical protein
MFAKTISIFLSITFYFFCINAYTKTPYDNPIFLSFEEQNLIKEFMLSSEDSNIITKDKKESYKVKDFMENDIKNDDKSNKDNDDMYSYINKVDEDIINRASKIFDKGYLKDLNSYKYVTREYGKNVAEDFRYWLIKKELKRRSF